MTNDESRRFQGRLTLRTRRVKGGRRRDTNYTNLHEARETEVWPDLALPSFAPWGIHPIPIGQNQAHTPAMSQKSVILLAEDDPNDVFLLKRTFNKAGIPNPLHCVRDGEEAIAYLAGNGKYANRLEYP